MESWPVCWRRGPRVVTVPSAKVVTVVQRVGAELVIVAVVVVTIGDLVIVPSVVSFENKARDN